MADNPADIQDLVNWAVQSRAEFDKVMRALSNRDPAIGAGLLRLASRAQDQADDLPIGYETDRPIALQSHPLERLVGFARRRGVTLRIPGTPYANPACNGAKPYTVGPVLNEACLRLVGASLPATVMAAAPPQPTTSPNNFINAINREL